MMARLSFLVLVLSLASVRAECQTGNSFAAFLAGLRPEAARQGITQATFDAAFAGLTSDPNVLWRSTMDRSPAIRTPA